MDLTVTNVTTCDVNDDIWLTDKSTQAICFRVKRNKAT